MEESMPKMMRMFKGANSFRQSLCGWGKDRSEFGIRHYQMFHGTACVSQSDPSEAKEGTWCGRRIYVVHVRFLQIQPLHRKVERIERSRHVAHVCTQRCVRSTPR